MKKLVSIIMFVLLAGCQAQPVDQSVPEPVIEIPPPTIAFEFNELFPKGGEVEVRTLTLELERAGAYRVGMALYGPEDALLLETSGDGELSDEEIAAVFSQLETIDFRPMDAHTMNIGYSPTSETGWRGRLAVNDADNRAVLDYTSMRPETYPERSVAMNRLVTLVFDLKNLALAKIDAPR
jgi:hypothetical protein